MRISAISTVITHSTLDMMAKSSSVIRSMATGISGSGIVAVQVSVMGNVITNSVTSLITDSNITATGNVTISAQDVAPGSSPDWIVVPAVTVNPSASGVIDKDADTIKVGASNWRTGDEIKYDNGGGTDTDIGGLTSGTTYYAIRVAGDPNKIKLAATADDALNGHAIDLTGTGGSGAKHRLLNDSVGGSLDLSGNILAVMVSVAGTGIVAVNGAFSGNVISNTIKADIVHSDVVSVSGNVDMDALSKAGILCDDHRRSRIRCGCG